MFVLDTNVVSELMRPVPHPVIASWVAERIDIFNPWDGATSNLFLTAGVAPTRLTVVPHGLRPSSVAVWR